MRNLIPKMDADDDFPLPAESDEAEETGNDLIPGPADDAIPDPVAFGLYYDPTTKCYYEKME